MNLSEPIRIIPLIPIWKIVWFWIGCRQAIPLLFPNFLYWINAVDLIFTIGVAIYFSLYKFLLGKKKATKSKIIKWVFLHYIWIVFSSLLSDYTWENPCRVFGFLLSSLTWTIIVVIGARYIPIVKSIKYAIRYYVLGVVLTTLVLLLSGGKNSLRFGNDYLLHPNSLAFLYSIAWLGLMFLPIFKSQMRVIFQVLFGILLVLTFSKTSLISAMVGLAIGMAFLKGWKRLKILLPTMIIAGLISVCIIDYIKFQIQYYINDPYFIATLTGRTVLWSWVIDMIRERPWIGYGYGSFRDIFAPYSKKYGFFYAMPHAHNAFLDVLFVSGYVGLLLFLIVIIKSVTTTLSLRFRLKGHYLTSFFIAVMLYILVRSLTEGVVNIGRDFMTFLYVALSAERLLFIMQRGNYESAVSSQLLPTTRGGGSSVSSRGGAP